MVTKAMELEMPMLQEVLEDSCGSEDFLEELLCKFRQWLKQQIHLPQDISDQRLKFFISTVKFDFEKAKKNLDALYTLHNLLPEFYDNFDPLSEDIKLSNICNQFIPLPKLTPDKYRVHIARPIDGSKFDILALMRYGLMIIEERIEEDIVTNNIIICDSTGVNMNHVIQYTPSLIKKIDICMTAYGLRIKAVHIINAPPFVDIIMKMAKPILKAKLFNRIHVHTSGIESLYKTIPKSILPLDYGGEQPSMDTLTDMWHAKLVERRDWCLKEGKRKANESLRTNSIINPDDLFGIPGTFRQLQFD
nr:PREDICTED: alpha-tocopherol transfer protein-like isoform X2 [Linepithema humile]XP_012231775.1 PREDICTED: alpha-tocopherol transfer protein-like isoform X2 [Linepithema humile]